MIIDSPAGRLAGQGGNMSDVKCPYCGGRQEICHDDGYGYDEDAIYSQECSGCKKDFIFTVAILLTYETHKAPCLNGEPHDYQKTRTHPVEYARMRCSVCGEEREMTAEERGNHE